MASCRCAPRFAGSVEQRVARCYLEVFTRELAALNSVRSRTPEQEQLRARISLTLSILGVLGG